MSCQPERSGPDLAKPADGGGDFLCDTGDPGLRCQRVADHRHSPAAVQQPGRQMREIILRQRHPVAAMNDADNALRGVNAAGRQEQIIAGARIRAIGKITPAVLMAVTKGGGVHRPGGQMPVGIRYVKPVFIRIIGVGRR